MKTIQRKLILNYLKNTTSHPTARDIFLALSEKENSVISLATVYNTLAYMKKKGLVREIAIPSFSHKRYDANMASHAHLICTRCGAIADVHFPLHIGLPEEHRQGFYIQDSEINFYGHCLACQDKEGTSSPLIQKREKI
jgi:Fur family peroxide stress response transcriptional regulator